MRIFRHYEEIPRRYRGGVVALGNFDGVHRHVIGEAIAQARVLGVPSGVMTFEPHPRRLFQPDLPPFTLTPFRIKARHMETLDLAYLYVQHFDADFAAKPAETFVDEVLIGGLGVRHVVVGEDYVFGKGRGGNVAFLSAMAAERGFGVTAVPPIRDDAGVTFSSTRARTALAEGRPREAAEVLGRPWEVEGRVEHGDKRGRTIGFPTANLALGDYLRPKTGVYAVHAGVDRGAGTEWLPGVANYGRRPTFDKTDDLLEVHLFDFDGDLYLQHLRVRMIAYLRPEQAFSGIDALKAQIAADADQARRVLATQDIPADGPNR
jgi:riboflavin kinase/FMN adenylyltransferase